MSPMELSRAALEKGIFSRTTARRNEDLAIEMLAPRYLGDGGLVASRIKFLVDHGFPYESIVQIFFLQTARAHEIFINDEKIDDYAEEYGKTMSLPADYTELLSWIASARVRLLLSDLMSHRDYVDKVKEENLGFLRTDRAFEKCMEMAYKKWRWVHKKL